jgi:rSAM/selenodomain-associated transferase 1
MRMPTAISILAKAPEPGRCKMRLCPPLTPVQAAELSAALLVDTWRAVAGFDDAEILLMYSGDRTRFPEPMRGLTSFLQRGADLGARIEHAARVGLTRADAVIVVGSDLPELPLARLAEARDALTTHEAVLGPSRDGGFYLIGLRACAPGLLARLPWSVPETYAACAARLTQRQMRPAHLAAFDDVDDIEDLRRIKRQLDAGTLVAPATAAFLERLGNV